MSEKSAAKLKVETVKPRGHLFREGDAITKVFIVRAGQFSLYRRTPEGLQEIRRVGVGEILGESAFLGDQYWKESAVALLESRVEVVSSQVALHTMDRLPLFFRGLFRQIMNRLLTSEEERLRLSEVDNKIQHEFELSMCRCLNVILTTGSMSTIPQRPSERELRACTRILHQMPYSYVQNVLELLCECDWAQRLSFDESVYFQLDADPIRRIARTLVQALNQKRKTLLTPPISESRLLTSIAEVSRSLSPNGKGIVRLWTSDLVKHMRELDFEPNLNLIDRISQRGLKIDKHSNDQGLLLEFQKDDVEDWATSWKLICLARRRDPFTSKSDERSRAAQAPS